MINNENNEMKGNVMNNVVVRIEKSGNRFNRFGIDKQVYFSNLYWFRKKFMRTIIRTTS